jgi:hypothetical protein
MQKTQVPQLDYLSAVTISFLLSGGASHLCSEINFAGSRPAPSAAKPLSPARFVGRVLPAQNLC